MFAIRIPSGMEAKRIKEKQFIEEVVRQGPVLLFSGFHCVLVALVYIDTRFIRFHTSRSMLTETFGDGNYYSYDIEEEAGLNRSSYFSKTVYRKLI